MNEPLDPVLSRELEPTHADQNLNPRRRTAVEDKMLATLPAGIRV